MNGTSPRMIKIYLVTVLSLMSAVLMLSASKHLCCIDLLQDPRLSAKNFVSHWEILEVSDELLLCKTDGEEIVVTHLQVSHFVHHVHTIKQNYNQASYYG